MFQSKVENDIYVMQTQQRKYQLPKFIDLENHNITLSITYQGTENYPEFIEPIYNVIWVKTNEDTLPGTYPLVVTLNDTLGNFTRETINVIITKKTQENKSPPVFKEELN